MKQRSKNAKSQMDDKVEQTAAQPKSPALTPEQIRRRSQQIFEARGRAPDCELDDWLQAEVELRFGLRGWNIAN